MRLCSQSLIASAIALCATTAAIAQPSASEVTPRTLRPEPVAPPPAAAPAIDLPKGVPAQAPKGSENLHVTVAKVTVQDGFADMDRAARKIFGPLQGRRVTVADLYMGAAALEQAYANAGYSLSRVAVPQQSIVDGGDFKVVVIDGFIEQIEDSKVPRNVRGPIRAILKPLVGRRHLKADLFGAKLALAGAVFGAHLRSTLAQGSTPAGALLVLDGGYSELGGGLTANNNLGPSFNNWGLNVTGQINSPTGHGEQAYIFLSGGARLDQDFGKDAARRIGGGGVIVPLGAWGLQVNPEVTVSDTHPVPSNPLLATHDRLYRGTLNWTMPVPLGAPGSTTAKITTELVDELTSLPLFGIDLSHDRLTIMRGALSWNGAWQPTSTGLHAEATVSKGVPWFGASGANQAEQDGVPVSRGGDPDFTKLEAKIGVSQQLPYAAIMNLTAHAQTTFHHLVPSSETFDLSSPDAVSSFTQGGLVSDAGVTVRAQLERQWAAHFGRFGLAATPYIFVAEGQALPVVPDDVTPSRALDFGLGLRLDGSGLPWGGAPSVALEYGHIDPDRGLPPRDRVQVTLGVQF